MESYELGNLDFLYTQISCIIGMLDCIDIKLYLMYV